MKTSESIKTIAPAFLKAQIEMAAAVKDAINPAFGTGRAYADLGSIIAAVKPALNNAGISYMQFPRLSEAGVEVETVLMHQSGEYLADTLTIPLGQRRDAQAVGSAISYGKRYGLQAICGLTSEDDDGNAASAADRPQGKQQPRQAPRRQENKPAPGDALSDPEDFRRALHAAFQGRQFTTDAEKRAVEAVKTHYKVKALADLKLEQRHVVLDHVLAGGADKHLNPEGAAA